MAHIQDSFDAFISLCSEDYLIHHANKGLYKRAIKEIEQGVTVQYEITDEHVIGTLSDGTVCRMMGRIDAFDCSCPSDKICKHVLIAILYHKQNKRTEGESGEQRSDFSWLLTLSTDEIARQFSLSQIEEVLFRLPYEEEIRCTEKQFLTIRLQEQRVDVIFEEEADMSRTVCNCRAKDACVHRLEALLRYRALHHIHDLPDRTADVSIPHDLVAECRQLIEEIMNLGLTRLPERIVSRLESTAIAAHNGQLPAIERSLRGLQGELALFFARHARFSPGVFLDRLTQAYMSLVALEQDVSITQKQQIIGQFKSVYHMIPRLELYALGANPWETRSGYRGITYYFYAPKKQQIYTYTDSRPVYYEKAQFRFEDQYRKKMDWSSGMTMQELSRSHVLLHRGKVNRERRLSGNEETTVQPRTRLPIEDIDLGPYLITDWEAITREPDVSLFSERQALILVLCVAKIGDVRFDTVHQNLILSAEDRHGHVLDVALAYSKDTASSIWQLEKSDELRQLRDVYLVVQRIHDAYYPISFMKEEKVTSLKLDL